MNTPEIACIVLNWNGSDRILRCIQSLLESQNVKPVIIVVDNGSSDGSPERIVREFQNIHVIRFGENLGLARARNEGIRWALEQRFPFILFIDNDALVTKECLAKLVSVLDGTSGAGIVTPRILDGGSSGRIWYDGGVTNILGNTIHRNMGRESNGVAEKSPMRISFATGCCMLTKREVFEKVGLLDEDYFVYSEDADFSFRASKSGFDIMHVPEAEARHDQSGDTKANRGKWFRDYYEVRNKLMLFERHYAGVKWFMAMMGFGVSGIGDRVAYFALKGEWLRCKAVLAGVGDFMRGRTGKRYS